MEGESVRERFIDTYDPPGELDPHGLVADFEGYVKYVAANPTDKSTAVARALGLPRSRVRPWIENGSMPDVMHGVTAAANRDWFATDADNATHRRLTRLVAAVFAGGSITEKNYWPRFSAADHGLVTSMLIELGVGTKKLQRDRPKRGNEIEPRNNSTVLGRILVARGAPYGNDLARVVIPAWFHSEPDAIVQEFVECYVALRGVRPVGRGHVQILEKGRREEYHDALGRLFGRVIDGEVRRVTNGLVISPAAV